MARDRVVTEAFFSAGPTAVLYGPGRYNFGDSATWWVNAHSEPTDDTSIPLGHSEIIGIDGLAAAFNRLNWWYGK